MYKSSEAAETVIPSTNEPKCVYGTWDGGECVCKVGYKTDHNTEDWYRALQPVYCNSTAHIVLQYYEWTGTDVIQLVSSAVSTLNL